MLHWRVNISGDLLVSHKEYVCITDLIDEEGGGKNSYFHSGTRHCEKDLIST
jgi:hypothetical protein